MKWLTIKNFDEMSEYGAQRIYNVIMAKISAGQRCNIGLATGNTMIKLYELLAAKLNAVKADLSLLHTYNLDEYVQNDQVSPVAYDHPLSYAHYMHDNLFSRFLPERHFDEKTQAHFPDPANPAVFDADLEANGNLDLQLLGIGFNGHIAFNEPMSKSEISTEAFAELPTRVIALREATLQQNCRLTAGGNMDTVPRYAVTMGMKQILKANDIMLLACFPEQAAPLTVLKNDGASPELPAAYICNHHYAEIVYTTDVITLG